MNDIYVCSNCRVSLTNRSDWCDLGCGSDYNEMIEVSGRRFIDYSIKIKNKLNLIIDKLPLEGIDGCVFEPHNFRVNSNGWKKIIADNEEYLENPEGDIWEILEGEANGEQLFTWNAAMRETKKAGKRMPTDEEFSEILKSKADMPNLILAGNRTTAGSFYDRGARADFWSSTESGANAWYRCLYLSLATVYRATNDKADGFSVRCLKEEKSFNPSDWEKQLEKLWKNTRNGTEVDYQELKDFISRQIEKIRRDNEILVKTILETKEQEIQKAHKEGAEKMLKKVVSKYVDEEWNDVFWKEFNRLK